MRENVSPDNAVKRIAADTAAVVTACKDLIWVVAAWLFVFFLLATSIWLAIHILDEKSSAEQSLRVMSAAVEMPAFVAIAIYSKISSEMIAVILGTIIGFVLGTRVGG